MPCPPTARISSSFFAQWTEGKPKPGGGTPPTPTPTPGDSIPPLGDTVSPRSGEAMPRCSARAAGKCRAEGSKHSALL